MCRLKAIYGPTSGCQRSRVMGYVEYIGYWMQATEARREINGGSSLRFVDSACPDEPRRWDYRIIQGPKIMHRGVIQII